jgi:hypothetical protein
VLVVETNLSGGNWLGDEQKQAKAAKTLLAVMTSG